MDFILETRMKAAQAAEPINSPEKRRELQVHINRLAILAHIQAEWGEDPTDLTDLLFLLTVQKELNGQI
jgi:hypothetical protein